MLPHSSIITIEDISYLLYIGNQFSRYSATSTKKSFLLVKMDRAKSTAYRKLVQTTHPALPIEERRSPSWRIRVLNLLQYVTFCLSPDMEKIE